MTGAQVNVRPVAPGDREGWLRLRRKLWPDGADGHAAEVDRFLAGAAEHPHAVIVATDDDRIVGFAELAVRPFAEGCVTSGVGYLEGWYVEENYRRRGVGRALLRAGEEWARGRGCAEFASDADPGNEASERAHLACGFEDAGTVRCFRKRLDGGRRSGSTDVIRGAMIGPVAKLSVRDYAPSDRAACLAVFDSNVPEFFTAAEREEFAAFLDRLPGPYLVLEDEAGRIVACGGYAIAPGTATADLCWGMVLRKLQGWGLGRRLTRERLERIRRDGTARAVALRTSQRVQGFYEGLGFVTERVVPDGLAPGLDQCEMRLEIAGTAGPGTEAAGGRQGPPRLYADLAEWWPLFSPPSHYVEEAAYLLPILLEAPDSPPRTLLELGSGGGSLAWHLKSRLRLTLTDRSERMLEVSRATNPECEHVVGDMRSLRLGRAFDLVLVHDAIMYATEPASVRATLKTAAHHCRPGGAVVVVPDFVRETFSSRTSSGGEDGPDGRGLRYVEWIWDPDPDDGTCEAAWAFLLRDRDGAVRVESDRHRFGLFSREAWSSWMREAGIPATSRLDPWGRDVFVGRKPSG